MIMDRCVELTRDADVSSHNDASSQLGLDDRNDRTTPTSVLALMNTSILVAAAGDVMFCLTLSYCAVEWYLNAYDTFAFRITRVLAQAVEGCCVGDGTFMGRCVHDLEFYRIVIKLTACSVQLGDGTQIMRKTPVAVIGISDVVIAVAAGTSHTCAATASTVYCWGSNSYLQVHCIVSFRHLQQDAYALQLGDGSSIQRSIPVLVSGLPSGANMLACGNVSL
jgi:hypothetical protein